MRFAAVALLALIPLACEEQRPPALSLDASFSIDIGTLRPDVRARLDVTPIDPCGIGPCGDTERCGPAIPDGGVGSGNGLDDDCDGRVDEGCPCSQGEMRQCFPGPADRRGVGRCADGRMRCTELAAWVGNECIGATSPAPETCNGTDDDCDGAIDEDLAGCSGTLRCPPSVTAEPLRELLVMGRSIDPTATGFAWSLECPPSVMPCPSVPAPGADDLRVVLPNAGTFAVSVEVRRREGRTDRCRFPAHVQGRGLRVNLDWDRKGGENGTVGQDLDLHVVAIDRRRPDSPRWFTPDDCYFLTCKAPGQRVRWALDASDNRFAPAVNASGCENAPSPWGAMWRSAGRCWNPRLDTDTITCDPALRDARDARFCFAENVQVDLPPEDTVFRVMVNFYRDHGTCADSDPRNDVAHPVVSVHCGGLERAALGTPDEGIVAMSCRDNPTIGSLNWSWLAADVVFRTNVCGVQGCQVSPLRVASGTVVPCSAVTEEGDVCSDGFGRVFVRRSGGRAADVEFSARP